MKQDSCYEKELFGFLKQIKHIDYSTYFTRLYNKVLRLVEIKVKNMPHANEARSRKYEEDILTKIGRDSSHPHCNLNYH